MKIDNKTLVDLDFVQTHYVIMEGEIPVFMASDQELQRDVAPCVYMWLSPISGTSELDVLYIGKAGYGVARRLQQHQGGFINSSSGRDNRRLIAEWLKSGRNIDVYRRESALHKILGQEIFLYSSEEQALCERFSPLWNRAKFPQANQQPKDPVFNLEKSIKSNFEGEDENLLTQSQRNVSMDFSNLAFGDEVVAFLDSLAAKKREHFFQVGELLQRIQPAAQQKITRFYTGQPVGYHNTPMYVFGFIGSDGKARRRTGWIPLVDSPNAPLTVIFPGKSRNPNLDPSRFSEGATGDWRPLELSDFLAHPCEYIING